MCVVLRRALAYRDNKVVISQHSHGGTEDIVVVAARKTSVSGDYDVQDGEISVSLRGIRAFFNRKVGEGVEHDLSVES